MVQVMLTSEEEPEWVALSQHHGGTRRAWADAPVEESTHPVAYVALGSHANYFAGDEVYPNGKDVGNARIEILDRTGTYGRVVPGRDSCRPPGRRGGEPSSMAGGRVADLPWALG